MRQLRFIDQVTGVPFGVTSLYSYVGEPTYIEPGFKTISDAALKRMAEHSHMRLASGLPLNYYAIAQ